MLGRVTGAGISPLREQINDKEYKPIVTFKMEHSDILAQILPLGQHSSYNSGFQDLQGISACTV